MLRKRCILLLYDRMFYIYLLNLIGPKLQLVFLMGLIHFCFPDGSIEESAVLKSPTIIVLGAMCALSFNKVSFMNEGALAFGAYII